MLLSIQGKKSTYLEVIDWLVKIIDIMANQKKVANDIYKPYIPWSILVVEGLITKVNTVIKKRKANNLKN